MINKEQRSKKSIAAEVIYSEKATKIFACIQEIKEELTNLGSKVAKTKTGPYELLTLLVKVSDKTEWLEEELMKQDIRVSIATGLIELHPYPTCCESERKRLGEVNREIESRVNSKNFPH